MEYITSDTIVSFYNKNSKLIYVQYLYFLYFQYSKKSKLIALLQNGSALVRRLQKFKIKE